MTLVMKSLKYKNGQSSVLRGSFRPRCSNKGNLSSIAYYLVRKPLSFKGDPREGRSHAETNPTDRHILHLRPS